VWGREKGEAAAAAYFLDGTVKIELDGSLSRASGAHFAARFAEVHRYK
jgi:hypothetical protein